MNLSEAWDRFFWSLIVVVFVGLLWMRFLQPFAACEGPGLIVSFVVGGIYFYAGFRRAARSKRESQAQMEADAAALMVDDPLSQRNKENA